MAASRRRRSSMTTPPTEPPPPQRQSTRRISEMPWGRAMRCVNKGNGLLTGIHAPVTDGESGIGRARPHPVIWTDERVAAWWRDGIRPPAAVWTLRQLIVLRGLRHGAALALASHTDLKVIQQMLGRSSIVTTPTPTPASCPRLPIVRPDAGIPGWSRRRRGSARTAASQRRDRADSRPASGRLSSLWSALLAACHPGDRWPGPGLGRAGCRWLVRPVREGG